MSSNSNLVSDAQDAAIVMAYRLPMLAWSMVWPTKSGQEEAVRMVTEKVEASSAGACALGWFWATSPLRMWQQSSPVEMWDDAIDAFTAPARKTLKSNVRRLSEGE